ncbi:MAG: selenide, water dikinase SelD [Sedimentisphaerales bacterium]|nr:selenide, water dikinase SelD [Sedimentisphaerales bacterium]
MIDMERRKRVMQRSIRLGHCICNPKQPCPCEYFKEKNICTCAGERAESPTGKVELTRLVEKAGCASKIDQAFLKEVLRDLPEVEDPRVLVGVPAGDDAGIYDLGNGQALVQTVDVFTPSVDDPYMFGQVAAANSVSDIYAMGGTPMTALSVIGFPARKIPDYAMNDILRGGIDKMKEAGVAIIGGHSINDDQIKAGFAVTGMIDPARIVSNAGAKPGDCLILTKPLGTGIVAFASQIGKASDESVRAAGESMATLNKAASELMVEFGAHAATDVTGFSLMGHLAEMARCSGVDVEVIWDDIPLFEGVLEYAAGGILPGALERNKESCGRVVTADESLPQEMVDICFDAQTSGGLLIAIAASDCEEFLKALHDAGVEHAAVVGKVLEKGTGRIFLRATGRRRIPTIDKGKPSAAAVPVKPQAATEEVACCADAVTSTSSGDGNGSPMDEVKARFNAFLSAASSPHGLDAYTKQAMAIALSVATRCEPCLKMHLANARKKGFTQAEIDEAAWMGISFAGSPAMVFYEQTKGQ